MGIPSGSIPSKSLEELDEETPVVKATEEVEEVEIEDEDLDEDEEELEDEEE